MRAFSWPHLVLGTIGLALVSPGRASPQASLRKPVSPGYRENDAACPKSCNTSGASYDNWSVYKSLEQTASCEQIIFSMFNIHDDVEDSARNHRIYSCSSHGSFTNLPAQTRPVAVVNNTNTTYQVGWWADRDGTFQPNTIQTLAQEMGNYFTSGYGLTNSSTTLFIQGNGGAAGVYIGKGLQSEGIAEFALGYLHQNTKSLDGENVAMQLCGPGHGADHTFGFFASSKGTFTKIQNAIKNWSKGDCVPFPASQKNISGPAYFTTPTPNSRNVTGSTLRSRHSKRDDCTAIKVQSGDSCGSLASECGISGDDFTKYNPDPNLCGSLTPGQHVCCSSGTLPDFKPKPNSDGSCAMYTVAPNDSCSTIGAANSLSNDDLEKYNSNTWGWEGCNDLMLGLNICLSSGSPPMPAVNSAAVCGPTKPGTVADGTDLADLNPCPLNACCNIWGQCGITAEFCTNTSTGAPGTAKPGTNGCISNCGTDIVQGSADTQRSVAYYEAFNFDRACLYQDIRQVDSSITHLHFSFASLDAKDYSVNIGNGNAMTSYEFENLKRLSGPKRILTFGGWAFSTDPGTYNIFREGVTAANRMTMATNIANFIKDNNLDGVDIDWEYPGAPDIPGVPPGNPDDGENYLAFLLQLKNLLGEKSLSIAAPASYWYLKGFPIAEISKVVDYIVFMAYDLHGQWDYDSSYSQDGCPTGNCLRSHVNLTETMTALSMITKAGVPSGKVVVGVSSYGRSFGMADPNCHTPDCFFTGSRTDSTAQPGICTNTSGYISNAEINEILGQSNGVNNNLQSRGSQVTASYIDKDSNSNIMVYGNNWVSYMSDDIKAERTKLYQGLGMGGSTLWASDLSKYNTAPPPSKDWKDFVHLASDGKDPYAEGNRTGNWTTLTCSDKGVSDQRELSPEERWNELDCSDAWNDAINVWTEFDRDKSSMGFTASISNTFYGPPSADCGVYGPLSNCEQTLTCQAMSLGDTGPAGVEIWNSMVIVHEMYSTYIKALNDAFSVIVSPSLQNLEDTFAPVPPPPQHQLLSILLAAVNFITGFSASAFFTTFMKKLPSVEANPVSFDNFQEGIKGLMGFGVGTAVAMTIVKPGDPGSWTPQSQAKFSQYLGQVVFGWANATELTMKKLFDGSDDDIKMLTELISDGRFLSGAVNGHKADPATQYDNETFAALEAVMAKSFFAYAIPTLWNASASATFIIDSGESCSSTNDTLSSYMPSDDINASGYCYNNNLYFLAYPHAVNKNSCSKGIEGQNCEQWILGAAPGIRSLDGSFGSVTLADIVTGAVRTYEQNGKQNSNAMNPTSPDSLEGMFKQDITTPGFINIPICKLDTAKAAIGHKQTTLPFYPCNIQPSPDLCGDSTFVGQTTSGSPKISDCQQIVKNIEGTDGKWEVENAIESQHELVHYGSCHFGVQGTAIKGNINYHVGAQDIVDIINSSIQKFSWNGLVGAKGDMNCNGDIKQQPIEWGLY